MEVLGPLGGLPKSQSHDDTVYGEAEISHSEEYSVDDTFVDAPKRQPDHRRVKLAAMQIRNSVKQQLQRADIDRGSGAASDIDGKHIPGITDNPAFDTGRLSRNESITVNSVASKAVDKIQKVSRAIAHPRESAKAKAAGKINLDEQPYITKEGDANLIQARKDLEEAESLPYGTSEDESDSSVHLNRVKAIEKERNNLRNAWITGKYVKRVRTVPQRIVKFPRSSDYRMYDSHSVYIRWNWEQYAGHFLLWLCQDFSLEYVDPDEDIPFRRGTLMHNAERFLIATAPWQSWLINIRQIYSWDDPWRTGRWFFLWLILIMTGHVMTFVWSYVAFVTLQNRFSKSSNQSLRESHERAIDEASQVHKLSELVRKHGDDQWIDPLLDEIGPGIQQQLGDLADYLEILINYYNWRNPKATAHTVIFWISCALLTGLTSAEFAFRVFWFICGLYFFLSRPFASKFPQYRHQLSIFRWVYFNIPTHADLAFSELKLQAQETKDAILKQGAPNGAVDPATISNTPTRSYEIPEIHLQDYSGAAEWQLLSDSHETITADESLYDGFKRLSEPQIPATDILSFHGCWQSTSGKLVISTTGIRFIRDYSRSNHAMTVLKHSKIFNPGSSQKSEDQRTTSKRSKPQELWRLPYCELVELRKSTPPVLFCNNRHPVGKSEALTICWFEDEVEKMENIVGTETLPDGENPHAPENNDRIGIGHNPKIHRKMRIETIDHMPKRDEAFNCIIGFSSLEFRMLPPLVGLEQETAEKAEKIDGEVRPDYSYRKDAGAKAEHQKRNSVFEELGKV